MFYLLLVCLLFHSWLPLWYLQTLLVSILFILSLLCIIISHPSSVRALCILPSSAVFHFDSDCIWSESLWMPTSLCVQSNQRATLWALSQFLCLVIHIYSPLSSYALDAFDILHMNFESDGIIYCHICDSLWLLWFYRTKQVFVFKKYVFDVSLDLDLLFMLSKSSGLFVPHSLIRISAYDSLGSWFTLLSMGAIILFSRCRLQLWRLVQLLIK